MLTACGSGGSGIVSVKEIEMSNIPIGGGCEEGCLLPTRVKSGRVMKCAIATGPVLFIVSVSLSFIFNSKSTNNLESGSPFSSDRQHLSCGDCLEVRGEIIRTVLCCIVY